MQFTQSSEIIHHTDTRVARSKRDKSAERWWKEGRNKINLPIRADAPLDDGLSEEEDRGRFITNLGPSEWNSLACLQRQKVVYPLCNSTNKDNCAWNLFNTSICSDPKVPLSKKILKFYQVYINSVNCSHWSGPIVKIKSDYLDK